MEYVNLRLKHTFEIIPFFPVLEHCLFLPENDKKKSYLVNIFFYLNFLEIAFIIYFRSIVSNFSYKLDLLFVIAI